MRKLLCISILPFILIFFSSCIPTTITANQELVESNNSFPADENGDVLRLLQERGDDLTKSRSIDFVVVLPNQKNAETFADKLKSLGYKTTIEKSGVNATLPWDVNIVKDMVPTYLDITNFEQELEEYATPLGGRNDGWGSFVQ